MTHPHTPLYLGFDLSTQQLKVVVCDDTLAVHGRYAVGFDALNARLGNKYPRLHKGVYSDTNTGAVTTPVALLIDAVECVLDEMLAVNFPFNQVVAISGSAQQHGTVFYTSQIDSLLESLAKDDVLVDKPWSEYLQPAFSYHEASNWQDRSTDNQLQALEDSVDSLPTTTGSRAHARFSAAQIRLRRCAPDKTQWENTSYIGIISSLLNSILTGHRSNIEYGDACGMNLLDISTCDWNDALLTTTFGDHVKGRAMLGPVDHGDKKCFIGGHLVKKYGFSSQTIVSPITGDNLATILSLPLANNDVLVSMGTSTTVLLVTDLYKPGRNHHVMLHPVDNSLYMHMICYSNGALAREVVRDSLPNKTWDAFNELLNEQVPHSVGVFYPVSEIIPDTPPCTRIFNINNDGYIVKELNAQDINNNIKPRLIVESQALSNRIHVSPALTTQRPRKVYYVGGSSQNEHLLSVYNEILDPIEGGFRAVLPDACALGGAYRAVYLSSKDNRSFNDWLGDKFDKTALQKVNSLTNKWDSYTAKSIALTKIESLLTKQ